MTATDQASPVSTPPPARRGFFRTRLIEPVLRQLTQGVSPRKVAFTLAIGTTCSLFPFLGFTWLLNLAVGIVLRLNQPILQTLNQLMTPVHLPMILVYVRLGERIWGSDEHVFSVTEMITSFAELSLTDFLQKFGWAGVHAFTAWLITSPLLFCVAYLPLRIAIDRFARTRLPVPPSAS